MTFRPNGFGITSGDTATAVLPASGFWPELSVAEFLRLYRLPAEYAEALIVDHLELARLWAAEQLDSWVTEKKTEGFETLCAVPFKGIEGGALRLYKRAVFCRAKGLLLPQFATIERREAARNDAKEGHETAEGFYAFAEKAVATLIGRTFIGVEAV